VSIQVRDIFFNGGKTDLHIEGNRIESIGERKDADIIVDGVDKAVFPAFINAHSHGAMTLLRGVADDLELDHWLREHIWPLEAKITEDDVYTGTKLACLEMMHSGTATFSDMYWQLGGAYNAVDEMGLRARLSAVFIDLGNQEVAKAQRKECENMLKEYSWNERIKPSIGPHSIYSVCEENLVWAAEKARSEGIPLHIHLSETEKEVGDCVKAHSMRPVEYLDSLGVLGPNLVAAHCIWLTDEEIKLLGDNKVKVVHCPTSNMKLASGPPIKYKELRKAGCEIALGTDGASSNNSLDIICEAKYAAMLQKQMRMDPTALSLDDAYRMLTMAGASALDFESGKVGEGMLADLVLVDLKKAEMSPLHNVKSNLMYSAGRSCIDSLICDGKILMEGGMVEGEEKIVEDACNVAKELIERK
jgi:5-methylthioadenosine/S-adenosylhomocysteine deaminase